jgi:hypothetical protein
MDSGGSNELLAINWQDKPRKRVGRKSVTRGALSTVLSTVGAGVARARNAAGERGE